MQDQNTTPYECLLALPLPGAVPGKEPPLKPPKSSRASGITGCLIPRNT